MIGHVAAFDHWRQRVYLIENVRVTPGMTTDDLDALYDEAGRRLQELADDLGRPLAYTPATPPDPSDPMPEVRSTVGSKRYGEAVEVAKEHILAGDIFQVVLSQRFDLDLGAEPFDVYRVLRQVNPSPYMYFLRHPAITVVGSSPEPMVQLRDGRVVSRPIAGTRRRGATAEDDRRLGGELREHPKEVAEHIMLVDLARNDVGRVVTFGTETVDELMTLERYSHVMHLTSQVSGDLVPGKGPIDVLRATLPAGTVSGAPKVRAMQIIDELEPTKRGPYAGVVGYFDFSGNLDTAISIRTMFVAADGRASVQAGAGIVADSDPAAEDLECRNKAAALLAAVPAGPAHESRERASSRPCLISPTACPTTTPRSGNRPAWSSCPATSCGWPVPTPPSSSRASCRRTCWPSAPARHSAWSLLLAPNGKVVALLRLTRSPTTTSSSTPTPAGARRSSSGSTASSCG